MTIYQRNNLECYVTNNERPTHGFTTGAKLYDTLEKTEYYWDGTYWLKKTIFDAQFAEGRWDGSVGSGLLSGPAQYGNTISPWFYTGQNRLSTRFLTAATTGAVAGQRIPNLITRRAVNPHLVYNVLAGNSTITKHRHGFLSYTTQIQSPVSNPLGNTDSGVLFGWDNGSTVKIYHNDGTGVPPTPVDTGFAVTTIHTSYSLQLLDTKVLWKMFNQSGGMNVYAEGEITTRIPSSTTGLTPHWYVETTDNTAINLYLMTALLRQKG